VNKDHDIVKELRAWGNAGVDNFVDRAADEIERLRADVMCLKYQNAEFVRNLTMAQDERNTAVAERDEARREVCVWQGLDTGNTPRDTATVRGWNCYEQDNWPSTKDRSEPDAEPQSPEA
jgi:hypothetical protein